MEHLDHRGLHARRVFRVFVAFSTHISFYYFIGQGCHRQALHGWRFGLFRCVWAAHWGVCIQVPKYIWARWNAFPLYQRWLMSFDGLRARASIGWMGRMDEKIPWAGKVGNINTRYPVLMHTKSNWVINQSSKHTKERSLIINLTRTACQVITAMNQLLFNFCSFISNIW
jgi:hypothetical protein